jgi:stearoyl-CoA desaturase (delta-9 desaturase)
MQQKPPLDWRNIILMVVVHVVAFGGMAIYVPLHGLSLSAALICASLTVLSIFSISAGYHRLFSHRTYEAHPAFKLFLLVAGAGTFQNSVLAWARNHRRHHARTDTDLDPYNAREGFWYSHIGWVFRQDPASLEPWPVLDLERDALVAWQDRHYALIGLAAGVGLPTALGALFGDAWGGFVVGAGVRLVLVYHATFSINSFAHMLGVQPYSDRNTSRDSLITALISMGEGYHNFHHTFPSDYRNGVGVRQYDPTKWILRGLAMVGVARNLRRTPQDAIVRARLRMDERRLAGRTVPPDKREHLERLRAALEEALKRWRELAARLEQLKGEASDQARKALRELQAQLKAVRREIGEAYASWQRLLRSCAADARA